MVIRQNRQARSAGDSILDNPSPHGFGHPPQFGVTAALEVVVALNLQSNILRPALGTLDKTIVERWHGLWAILQEAARKIQFTIRDRPGPREDRKKIALHLNMLGFKYRFGPCCPSKDFRFD
jgi:hypothetical protein